MVFKVKDLTTTLLCCNDCGKVLEEHTPIEALRMCGYAQCTKCYNKEHEVVEA
jgi:hypothetical protein